MSRLFYCPECKSENTNFKFKNESERRRLLTWINTRGGYGRAIEHIRCPKCDNPLSGVMLLLKDKDFDDNYTEIDYCKDLITAYNTETKDGGCLVDDLDCLKSKLIAKNEKRNKKEATPLIEEKKKIIKDLMGSASNQQIDFNKVRDEWRDNR